jgi:site-specific recombinase XerD
MIADDVLAVLANGITSLRDRALILVLAESGLRLGEIARLDRSSIASKSHVLPDGAVRIIGSGQAIESKWEGTVRDFFIGPLAMAALDEYLSKVRCDDREAPMFLSTHGRRLDSKAIQRVVQKLTDRLGLTRIQTYGFRYGLVLRLFNAGSSPCVVKRLLGYSLAGSFNEIMPPTQDTLVCDYLRAIGSFPWY